MKDVIKANRAIVWVVLLNADGIPRTKEALVIIVAEAAICIIKGLLFARNVVQLAAAELQRVGEVWLYAFWIYPDAFPTETCFEALQSNNGKQKPEEAD